MTWREDELPGRKTTSLIITILVEFAARGLIWARVLLIGFMMPAELYGFLILLISGEALFGSIICYPQVKDLLFRQEAKLVELGRTLVLFLIVAPLVAIAAQLYFDDIIATSVLLISTVLFALAQVVLYMLRVSDLRYYNRAKTAGAITSTIVFFLLLRRFPLLLPAVSAVHLATLLGFFLFRSKGRLTGMWSDIGLMESSVNWLIFGFQAGVFNLVQYGTRFVVGAAFTVAEVAVFAQTYMIASGITFYHAAIMVLVEKDLSRKITRSELTGRLRHAMRAYGYIFGGSVVYFLIVLGLLSTDSIPYLPRLLEPIPAELFVWFAILLLLQAIFSCINPVVISLGNRTASLTSSIGSLITQILLVTVFWNDLNLTRLGVFMVLGQTVTTLYLTTIGLRKRAQS